MSFKILAIGDVCGPCGVEYLKNRLWQARKELYADMVIVNGENSAEPNGIDKQTAQTLFESGADVITTGNHVFRKNSIFNYLDDCDYILRPLNFPTANPGHGDCIIKINGYRVLCINVLGAMYLDAASCPFEAVEKCLARNAGGYDFAALDIHAEATGEKKAIAYEFADKISACFGTHTHVQTNDAQILGDGCGYITDIGMVGATDSILGVKKEPVIYKLRTKMLSRFDFATGKAQADGALFEIDEDTGKCTSCRAVRF